MIGICNHLITTTIGAQLMLSTLQQCYANTHTEDDMTGRYMTKLLHKAYAAGGTVDYVSLSDHESDNLRYFYIKHIK